MGASSSCCTSKDKGPSTTKDFDPDFTHYTKLSSEEAFLMNIINDYLKINKLYCQQIYDVFRPYVRKL